MNRDTYKLKWSTTHSHGLLGPKVVVPDDVVRVDEHAPCFLCGQARGCRHRMAA